MSLPKVASTRPSTRERPPSSRTYTLNLSPRVHSAGFVRTAPTAADLAGIRIDTAGGCRPPVSPRQATSFKSNTIEGLFRHAPPPRAGAFAAEAPQGPPPERPVRPPTAPTGVPHSARPVFAPRPPSSEVLSNSASFQRGVVGALHHILRQQRRGTAHAGRTPSTAAATSARPSTAGDDLRPSRAPRPASGSAAGWSMLSEQRPNTARDTMKERERELHQEIKSPACDDATSDAERARKRRIVDEKRSDWERRRVASAHRERRREAECRMSAAASDSTRGDHSTDTSVDSCDMPGPSSHEESRSSSTAPADALREASSVSLGQREAAARRQIESLATAARADVERVMAAVAGRSFVSGMPPSKFTRRATPLGRPGSSSGLEGPARAPFGDDAVTAAGEAEVARRAGNDAFAARRYTEAYFKYNSALEAVTRATTCEVPQGTNDTRQDLRRQRLTLLLNRAAASMALLSFDACIRDCLEVVHLAGGAQGPASQHLLTVAKAWARAGKAYALQENFSAAAAAYDHVEAAARQAAGSGDDGVSKVAALAQAEKLCLPYLQRMHVARQEVRHADVAAALSSAAMAPLRDEAVLIGHRLTAAVAIDASRARAEVTAYVATLLAILSSCREADCSSLAIPLTGDFVRHLCEMLVLVATASFNSGTHFVGIALQKVEQCLRLRSDFRPALALKKTLDTFSEHLNAAAAHQASGRHVEAFEVLSVLLATPGSAGKVRAALHLSRAELLSKMRNNAAALSDVSAAIDADPRCAKAHAFRSRCYQEVGDYERALADLVAAQAHATATGQSNAYDDDLEALRAAMREAETTDNLFNGSSFRFGSSRPQTSSAGTGHGGAQDYRNYRWYSSSRPQSSHAGGGGGSTPRGSAAPPPAGPAVRVSASLAVLGLPPTAVAKDVKQRYKALILQCHPDKVVTASSEVQAAKLREFKDVSKAYTDLMTLLKDND